MKKFSSLFMLVLVALFVSACEEVERDVDRILDEATDYVIIDLNPVIEIILNEKDEVLDVELGNEESEILFGEKSFRNRPLDEIIDFWIKQLEENGFLDKDEEILIEATERIAERIRQRVEERIQNALIKISEITPIERLERELEKHEQEIKDMVILSELSPFQARAIYRELIRNDEITQEKITQITEKNDVELAQNIRQEIAENRERRAEKRQKLIERYKEILNEEENLDREERRQRIQEAIRQRVEERVDQAISENAYEGDYNMQTFRTEPRQDYELENKIRVINNIDELYSFYEKFDENYRMGELKEYIENIERSFFERRTMIAMVVVENSGSIRHRLNDLYLREGKLIVDISRIVPAMGTADMATWTILIDFPNDQFEFENAFLRIRNHFLENDQREKEETDEYKENDASKTRDDYKESDDQERRDDPKDSDKDK